MKMDKLEITTKEMAELEARLTQINVESESILAWLRIKRIEYLNAHKTKPTEEVKKIFKRK